MPSNIIRAARAYFKHTTENAVCEEDKALRAALDSLPGNVVGTWCISCGQFHSEDVGPGHDFVALLAVPREDIEGGVPDEA